jgi:hypothetical protein
LAEVGAETEVRSNPHFVRDLLEPEAHTFWRDEDLAALLKHELAAPVQVEVASLTPGTAAGLAALCGARGLLLNSFADLFSHPHPPLELLRMTKRFAKGARHHPDSPLPAQVANVLYYASIAAAMVRCGQRITELDDSSLRNGLEWCTSRDWVDAPLRGLLREAEAALAAGSGSSLPPGGPEAP